MAGGDGNGWVECRCGSRHWGRFGAAGLLLVRPAGRRAADRDVLMQLRASWTHEGGRWGLLGGARDSHESVPQTALREAAEEGAVDPLAVEVLGVSPGADHGDWRYDYVLGVVRGVVRPQVLTAETEELRWVHLDAVGRLPLHAGLDAAWDGISEWIETHLPSRPEGQALGTGNPASSPATTRPT